MVRGIHRTTTRALPGLTSPLRVALALMLAVLVASTGAAQFEGRVESRNSTIDETGQTQEFVMTMWVSPQAARVETRTSTHDSGTVLIYRNDPRVLIILDPAERTYQEVRREAEPDPGKVSSDRVNLERTGRKRKILGFHCEHIVMRDGDHLTEMWAATGLEHLVKAVSNVLEDNTEGSADAPIDQLRLLGLYPLAAVTTIGGAVVERHEVTRIEPAKVPRTLFEVPSGYTKFIPAPNPGR